MRRLNKTPKPQVLEVSSQEWTARFMATCGSGEVTFTPWRESSLVTALVLETGGKCAYCEAVIADVAAPNVEHIAPKSQRPDLVVDWHNLTLACPSCNSAKGAYYSASAPLLNPYVDDPERHLIFAGPAVTGRPGDNLGAITVAKLKLMRAALVVERSKRIQNLADLIDRWFRAPDDDSRLVFEEVVRDALGDDAEFVGTLRAYAALVGFPVPVPVAGDGLLVDLLSAISPAVAASDGPHGVV